VQKGIRILIGSGCVLLLLITWIIAVNVQTPTQRQLVLIVEATEFMNDGVYVRAVPLLEEASGINAANTMIAEAKLKEAYLALIDTRGFSRRYMGLLERQMSRRDADSGVFAEAANHQLRSNRIPEALLTLKDGIERTGCSNLVALYELNRYAFEIIRTSFEYISEISGGMMQVRQDGMWGIAGSNGIILIPCEYEKISTFSVDRAIVKKDGEIFALDRNNNRIALLRGDAQDFGNLADNRIPILIDGMWRRSTGDFTIGSVEFDEILTYSYGYAAASVSGRWGVIGFGTDWLVQPEFDAIITDELGRSYGQGAVFVRMRDRVYLIADGKIAGEPFEDARPFTNEGYAAVRRNGKWGFIDIDGVVKIDFVFDDALSFGQHLAAVRVGEYWGYISRYGQIVIPAEYLTAKSFSNGRAPIQTERGWQIITLLEFKERTRL